MTDVQTVHRRYRAYAGFVTTPRYFDDSPQQFLQVAPIGTGVLQRVNHIPGYAYELEDTGLRHCAVVATRYGADDAPLGVLGVLGPSRMDYGRVIPLVQYLSDMITRKLRP